MQFCQEAKELFEHFIEDKYGEILNLICTLCEICSPTGKEKEKAEYIRNYINLNCEGNAFIDDVGNVIYNVGHIGKTSVFCAHIDTVFEQLSQIKVKRMDGIIYAPSVSDNCANIVALLFFIRFLEEYDVNVKRRIMFAFTVGEEGLGNLIGIREIVDGNKENIQEVIAIDGSCNSIVNHCIGSNRYKITVQTKGGRAWKDFGNDNAVAILANIISGIYRIDLSTDSETTYNVGKVSGGTAINAIANTAEMLFEIRSLYEDKILFLESKIKEIIEECRCSSNVELELIGKRPCEGKVNTNNLQNKVLEVRNYLGMETKFSKESTDMNYPLSKGIPAITFGARVGGKNHTINEFLDTHSIFKGYLFLYLFIYTFYILES